MKKIIIFCLLVISFFSLAYSSTAKSYKSYNSLIKQSSIHDFSTSAAIIIERGKRISISESEKVIIIDTEIIKVLDDRGIRMLGEQKTAFNANNETVSVLSARTYLPDGKVLDAENSAMHIKDRYTKFSLYSNAKDFIISMPGLEKGAIMEIVTEKVIKKLLTPGYTRLLYLVSLAPILYNKIEVEVPRDMPFHYKTLNAARYSTQISKMPLKKTGTSTATYIWESRDIRGINIEPRMPPPTQILPAVLISTIKDNGTIYNWWKGEYKDKIDISDEMRTLLNEIREKNGTEEQRINAVYEWVATNVRYVGVEYGDAGYEPHKASLTFKNKYGDCKDKVILSIALLKGLGIDAFPALIYTVGRLRLYEEMPILMFNHVILYAGDRFFDPTSSVTPVGYLPVRDQNKDAFVFFNKEYKFIKTPLFAPQKNYTITDYRIKLLKNKGAEIERVQTVGGKYSSKYKGLKYVKKERREKTLKKAIITKYPGAKIKKIEFRGIDNLDSEVCVIAKYSVEDFIKSSGRSLLLPKAATISLKSFNSDTRDFPLYFGTGAHLINRVEYIIPKTFEIKSIPDNVDIDTFYIKYQLNYTRSDTGVVVYEDVLYKLIEYSSEQYKQARKNQEKIVKLADERIPLITKAYKLVSDGKAFAQTEDYDLAREKFEEAIELDTGYGYAYNQLGYLYYKTKDYEKAAKYYIMAVSVDSSVKQQISRFYAAKSYKKLGQFDSAVKILEEYLKYEPERSSYYKSGQRMLEKMQEDRGASPQKRISSDVIQESKRLVTEGKNLARNRDYTGALEQFEAAIKINPDYAYAYNQLGYLYYKHYKNYKKAAFYYMKAIAADNTERQQISRYYAAKSYKYIGEYDSGVKVIKEYLRFEPEDSRYYQNARRLLQKLQERK